jgi:hypothetical protein
MNKKWECFLCAVEMDFEIIPSGWLSDYHPLCNNCANEVLEDESHEARFRLTYHEEIGNLKMVANIPISMEKYLKN